MRNCQTILQSGCLIIHTHWRCYIYWPRYVNTYTCKAKVLGKELLLPTDSYFPTERASLSFIVWHQVHQYLKHVIVLSIGMKRKRERDLYNWFGLSGSSFKIINLELVEAEYFEPHKNFICLCYHKESTGKKQGVWIPINFLTVYVAFD